MYFCSLSFADVQAIWRGVVSNSRRRKNKVVPSGSKAKKLQKWAHEGRLHFLDEVVEKTTEAETRDPDWESSIGSEEGEDSEWCSGTDSGQEEVDSLAELKKKYAVAGPLRNHLKPQPSSASWMATMQTSIPNLNKPKPVDDASKALMESAQKILGDLLGIYLPTYIEPLIDNLSLYIARYPDDERETIVKELLQIHCDYFRNRK